MVNINTHSSASKVDAAKLNSNCTKMSRNKGYKCKELKIVSEESKLWQGIISYYAYIQILFSQKQLTSNLLDMAVFNEYKVQVDNFQRRSGVWANIEEDTSACNDVTVLLPNGQVKHSPLLYARGTN